MKKKKTELSQPGRFAYEGPERVLHEKARLGIMTSLVMRPEGLVFSELKRLCAGHRRKLESSSDVKGSRPGGSVEGVRESPGRRRCAVWLGGRPPTLPCLPRRARTRHPRRDAEGGQTRRTPAGSASRISTSLRDASVRRFDRASFSAQLLEVREDALWPPLRGLPRDRDTRVSRSAPVLPRPLQAPRRSAARARRDARCSRR